MDLTTYCLTIEYDGTDFSGWQIQPNERTIQQCVEDAVHVLFRERVSVIAAGRTDAGVHATGQVVHFRTQTVRTPHVVVNGLNANLPPDVRVRSAVLADSDFHARFSAKWRGYVYRITLRPVAVERMYCWQCPFDLDVDAMRAASKDILGSHSFRAFAHEGENETHYLSDMFRADWVEKESSVELHIDANRFLHGMVRLLVGTFVNIGRGKFSVTAMKEILESQDVRRAGPKAPASGLTLASVGYQPWPLQ